PTSTSTAGQKYSLRQVTTRPIVTGQDPGGGGRCLDRGDHREQVRALLAGRRDEVCTGHRGLRARTRGKVARGDPLQVAGGHREQPLLELLALLAGEPGEPVDRLATALGVGRLQGVDIAARAEDRLLERLFMD